MKTKLLPSCVLFIGLTIGSAGAQEVRVVTEAEKAKADAAKVVLRKDAPNEITGKRVVYSGSLVRLAKTDNPAQLINPLAPAEEGDGEANLAVDPIEKKPRGIALLRLRW
jgi:hypothetical protein